MRAATSSLNILGKNVEEIILILNEIKHELTHACYFPRADQEDLRR